MVGGLDNGNEQEVRESILSLIELKRIILGCIIFYFSCNGSLDLGIQSSGVFSFFCHHGICHMTIKQMPCGVRAEGSGGLV